MDRRNRKKDNEENKLTERLIKLNRVAKVVKGGRRFSFSALAVVGDQNGHVGIGFGKANDVTDAIKKAMEKARNSMIEVTIKKNTIPHEIVGKYKSASVLLRPAVPGTGVIAGGAVRAVCDAAGITDILSKSLGSKNTMNIVKATFDGLTSLFNAPKMAKNRGKSLNEMWG